MWSKDKKLLEERLAESLKGKIEYVMEGGNKTAWGATYKVEMKYTGKPVVRFGEEIDYLTDHYEYPYKYDDGNITLIKA